MRQTGTVKAALLVALMVIAPACEPAATTTTTPTPVTGHVNESFVGTIDVNGTSFYSFTSAQGAVALTLLSVRQDGVDIGDELILGIGTPVATRCDLQSSVRAAAGTSAQISGTVAAGVYCARVADGGTLTGPVTFAVNIARPGQ
jgi:hypothetical protein